MTARNIQSILRPGGVCALVLVVLLPACGAARQSHGIESAPGTGDRRFAPVRAAIARTMAELDLPSVSVAAVQRGRIVWEESFGWADRERRVPATPHTPYSLASVSKPITATGLLVLAERGLVDLDAPANAYLGGLALRAFIGDAGEATVRRLLTHTAGLPTHHHFLYEDEDPPPQLEEAIRRYGILVYPPGERSVYANLGYGVLDRIIGRVSGRGFARFMQEDVFAPLGLTRTSIGAPPASGQAAVRYGADGRPLPRYGVDHVGASDVFASAHDLMRLALFHLGRPLPDQEAILDSRSLRLMQRPHEPAGFDSPGQWRGLGWAVSTTPRGFLRVAHTGSMPGVSSVLALYPDEGVAVTVLVNRNSGLAALRIAERMADALLPARPLLPARLGPAPGARSGRGRIPPALRGAWAGRVETWEASWPFALEVQPDGTVFARLGDGDAIRLDLAGVEGQTFVGRLRIRIPAADAARHPHVAVLRLHHRRDRLTGWIAAVSSAPESRYALSSWVEVTRQPQ